MTYELTNEDKISVVMSQARQVNYTKYTAEIQLIIENAVDTPNETRISEINAEIARCNAQISALTLEIERLS